MLLEALQECPRCNSARTVAEAHDTCTCSQMSIDVEAFLDAVSDPLNPACCPYCLCILVKTIEYSNETLSSLTKHCHEMWKRCIIMLVVHGESEVPRLRRVLRQNQFGCIRRTAQHKAAYVGDKLDDPFDALIDALCGLIHSGMTKGKNPIVCAERTKQSFHRRRGVWPKTPESLFPLGVARTVNALVHWCCAPMSPAPFVLLKAYLMAARGLVMPLLLQSPRRELLLWAVLQAVTPTLCVPWPAEPPFVLPQDLSVPLSLRGAALVEPAMALLHAIRSDCGAHPADAARFVAGYEATLLNALEGLPVASDSTSASKADATALEVTSLKTLLLGLLARKSDVPHPVDLRRRAGIVHDFLEQLRAVRTCAGPGCCAAGPGVRRYTCELCRVVRYCSRECQRADWNHGVPRHKDMCPLLSSLFQRGARLGDSAEFVAAIDEIGYDPQDVDILYGWATGSGHRSTDNAGFEDQMPTT